MRLMNSHSVMLASVQDSNGSRKPVLGSWILELAGGYGFHSLRRISSSSFTGRDTEMSRMLIPHGRPTYMLHILLPN